MGELPNGMMTDNFSIFKNAWEKEGYKVIIYEPLSKTKAYKEELRKMLEGLDDDIVAVYVERIEKEDKMKVLKEIENEIKELKNKKPEPKPAEIEEEFKDLDSLGGLTPEEFNAFEEKDHIGWYGRSEYEMAMYEYILSKHNNDCIPLVIDNPTPFVNKKFLLGIRLNKNGKLTGNVYNERGFHELKTDFAILKSLFESTLDLASALSIFF